MDLVLLVGSSGDVVGYQIDKGNGGHGYIPLPAQLAVSGDALVVPDITEEFVQATRWTRCRGRRVPESIGADVSESIRGSIGRKVVSRASAQNWARSTTCSLTTSSDRSLRLSSGKGKRLGLSTGRNSADSDLTPSWSTTKTL